MSASTLAERVARLEREEDLRKAFIVGAWMHAVGALEPIGAEDAPLVKAWAKEHWPEQYAEWRTTEFELATAMRELKAGGK